MSVFVSMLNSKHTTSSHTYDIVLHGYDRKNVLCWRVCKLSSPILPLPPRARLQVNFLCQAANLMVTVKTHQFKKEIAAKKAAGDSKGKSKRAARDKDAPKQD